jgi:hypothetical protein
VFLTVKLWMNELQWACFVFRQTVMLTTSSAISHRVSVMMTKMTMRERDYVTCDVGMLAKYCVAPLFKPCCGRGLHDVIRRC